MKELLSKFDSILQVRILWVEKTVKLLEYVFLTYFKTALQCIIECQFFIIIMYNIYLLE